MEIEIAQNIQNKFPTYLIKDDHTVQLLQLNTKLPLSKNKKEIQESQLLKFLEGGEEIHLEKKVQKRNSKLRAEAIKQYGYNCCVCGFNFEDYYGEFGVGYIEVHHLKPLAATKNEIVTGIEDVAVVCSNCHSVLHRQGKEPMLINTLKRAIEEKKKSKN